jgi:hypothetical protein
MLNKDTSEAKQQEEFNSKIEEFLDEFISVIYRGHDHIVARKYYRDLFHQLIPEYFCLKDKEKNDIINI